MKTIFAFLFIVTISTTAFADYDLARNGRRVVCYGEDNMSFVLNARRTTINYTVEGESMGPNKIIKVLSDGRNRVTFVTSEGALTLSNKHDMYRFRSEDAAFPVRCQ